MARDLNQLLESLGPDVFSHGRPCSPGDVADLEAAIGRKLPADYRESVIRFGPWEVRAPNVRIGVTTVSDAILSLEDEMIVTRMPGIVVVGTDGGAFAYYYDPTNQLGRGELALFLIDWGTLLFEQSVFVASTLTEAVEAALAGEDFRDRDPIGERPD